MDVLINSVYPIMQKMYMQLNFSQKYMRNQWMKRIKWIVIKCYSYKTY